MTLSSAPLSWQNLSSGWSIKVQLDDLSIQACLSICIMQTALLPRLFAAMVDIY